MKVKLEKKPEHAKNMGEVARPEAEGMTRMNVFERKYCIMDNAGNYYGVNEYDELCVAKGEESAEYFDILEANKRINNSGMSKTLRTVAANKKLASSKKKTMYVNQDEAVAKELDMEQLDLVLLSQQLYFLYGNLAGYQKKLKQKQLIVDEEICDIMHFIELYQRDEALSLELVNQLQDCRERRRSIKDEIYRTEVFTRIFNTGGMGNILKDVNRQLKHMEIREYIPRRLHTLFMQGVKRDFAEENAEESKVQEMSQQAMQEDETVITENVIYERHSTSLDEKTVDWNSMVTGQAELFENIEQYAINLTLDLEDLDRQIELLMETCEEANCNVAQGYKMFKQLKELRLQRREKMQELDQVNAITGCFDCRAMAETYQYLQEVIAGNSEQETEQDAEHDRIVPVKIENQEDIREAI